MFSESGCIKHFFHNQSLLLGSRELEQIGTFFAFIGEDRRESLQEMKEDREE